MDLVAVKWVGANFLTVTYTDGHGILGKRCARGCSARSTSGDGRRAELLDREAAGQKLRLRPETAYRRTRDLKLRLTKRLADLEAQ